MAASLLAACLFALGGAAFGQVPDRLPPEPILLESAPVEPPSAPLSPPDARDTIIRTAAQMPPRDKERDAPTEFVINTELPGPNRLFERYSEADVFERLRQEARKIPGSPKVYFPEEKPVSTEAYTGRIWNQAVARVEAGYVCHGRLLFEQPNFERYGWDLGVLTPFANVGVYWYDMLMLPYHYWTEPCKRWDSSAGKCLPGDRVPLLLYREKFSWTGLAAQAGAVTAAFYIFP